MYLQSHKWNAAKNFSHENYFLNWNCYTKTITLGPNTIPVSYLFHINFGKSIDQEDKNDKKTLRSVGILNRIKN